MSHKAQVPMPTTSNELFKWVEEWFQPLGERIETLEEKNYLPLIELNTENLGKLNHKQIDLDKAIFERFDNFGKLLTKFDNRIKEIKQPLAINKLIDKKNVYEIESKWEKRVSDLHKEYMKILKQQKQTIKGVEQQLTEVLNLGPTITQKKMWLEELMGEPLSEECNKEMLSRMRKLK